jgi:hypothetical protein
VQLQAGMSPHRCPEYLWRPQVSTTRTRHHTHHVEGCRGTEDGANIARVLDAVEKKDIAASLFGFRMFEDHRKRERTTRTTDPIKRGRKLAADHDPRNRCQGLAQAGRGSPRGSKLGLHRWHCGLQLDKALDRAPVGNPVPDQALTLDHATLLNSARCRVFGELAQAP